MIPMAAAAHAHLVAEAFHQNTYMVSDSKMAFLIKNTGLQSMTQNIRADKGTDLAPCQHVVKSQQCPWALQPSLQGHRILEDRSGSFLLKQRTQTLLSEVARCSALFLTDFSPAAIANTCQWGQKLVPDPTARKGSGGGSREEGSQIPYESQRSVFPLSGSPRQLWHTFLCSPTSSWAVGVMVLFDQTPQGQGLQISPLYDHSALQGLGAEVN